MDSIKPRTVIVLPLFPDKAASVPMVKHAMHVVKDDTQFPESRPNTSPWHGPANMWYWKAHSVEIVQHRFE